MGSFYDTNDKTPLGKHPTHKRERETGCGMYEMVASIRQELKQT